MAARPRFGGGNNMEEHTTKNTFLHEKSERKTSRAETMDIHWEYQMSLSGDHEAEERTQIKNEDVSAGFSKSHQIYHSRKEEYSDVEGLISVLESLGIHVQVKKYIRSFNKEKGDKITSATKSNTESYAVKTGRVKNDILYCKNLFLKDRKGRYYFVIAEESAHVDLKILKQQLNAVRNLSFADSKSTEEILGVKPGEINPFVAMRHSTRDVRFVLHSSLLEAKYSNTLLAFHPLDGSLQVDITVDELMLFIDHYGRTLELLSATEGSNDKHSFMDAVTMEMKHSSSDKEMTTHDVREKRKESDHTDDFVVEFAETKDAPKDTIAPNKKEIDFDLKIVSRNSNGENGDDSNTEHQDPFHTKKGKDQECEDKEQRNKGDAMNKNSREVMSCSFKEMTKKTGEGRHKEAINFSVSENLEETDSHNNNNNDKIRHSASLLNDKIMLNPKINGKPLWKVYMRKGKLKSFLKNTENNIDNGDPQPTTSSIKMENVSGNESEIKDECSGSDTFQSKPEIKSKISHEKPSAVQVEVDGYKDKIPREIEDSAGQHIHTPEADSSPILPEINEFYFRLSELHIQYQDIDLRMSTTRDIGPSIGCKCFFLKDRRANFFLVITHEYYELDHGRLKKALKPRKKIDHAEAADILSVLGVQPLRVTPFSCTTERARAKEITVFMTDKIRPPEVVLCIQHPFADGRRIVMTSGDLEKYLLSFIPQIGSVEEKVWADRFNWIFTRFTNRSEKEIRYMAAMDVKEINMGCSSTGHVFEGDVQENANNNILSNNNYHCGSVMSNINPSLLSVCKNISRVCLGYIGLTNIPWNSKFHEENVDNNRSSNRFRATEGSSVDPIVAEVIEESQANYVNSSETDNCPCTGNRLKMPSHVTTQTPRHGTDVRQTEYIGIVLDGSTKGQGIRTTSEAKSEIGESQTPCKNNVKRLQTDSTLFTVENIEHNLREMGVYFIITKGDMGKCVAGEEEANENAEICSTSCLHDDRGNYYVIIGGEADYVTPRRFCRRFRLPGRLKICEIGNPEITTTPFSVAAALTANDCMGNVQSKVYVVLFSSLYIDPDTPCVFRLDQRRTKIRMTSANLEDYVTKAGMEVWYMP